MAKKGARATVYTPELDSVLANQINAVWDDQSYEVRRDGPKEIWERPNSRSGRNVTGEAVKRSYMQQMEDLACSLMVWVPSDGIDRYLEEQAAGWPGVGRPRQFGTAEFLLFEFAAQVWGGYRAAERNLGDRKNYKRLRKAVKRAWSDHPQWRLSKRPITRSQHYRFRKKLLMVRYPSGKPVLLVLLRQMVVLMSLQGALHIGLFDRMRGSVTNPDTTQVLTGDATWLPGMFTNPPPGYPGHDSEHPWDPDVRHKPGGGNAFGHMAVFTIARNPYRNERVIIASDLLPQSPGKSDANLFTDVVIDILDKHPDLTAGVRAVVYDMALRSRDIDRLQDHGLHAIVKIPRTSRGKTAAVNLGNHSFKHPETNTITSLPVIGMHGTPVLKLVDGDGHTTYQPLKRVKTQVKTSRRGKKTMYGTWTIPDKPVVPKSLVGATTLIRHNSTPQERHSKPHQSRNRALSTIPESDQSFKPLHGVRQDTESTNSQAKSLLPHGRVRTVGQDRVLLNLLAFQIVTLDTALVAHHNRTGKDISDWYGNHRPNTRAGPVQLAA